jgi:tripartite-type tricarboxylate transporter receptor subunit TctC
MVQGKKNVLLYLVFVFVIFLSTGWFEQVRSQPKYPTRPVDIIVGFPAGGSTDIATRTMAFYLEKRWGTRVNVINKPGGNAIPAILEVLKAAPDGYTLFGDGSTSCSLLHVAHKDLPFKITDRNLISIWAFSPQVVFVQPASPFKTLKDAEAEAKKDPENFTWTSLGGGSPQDFYMKQFFKSIGVDILKTKPVMCKGGAQTITLTAGGHVKLGSSALATTIPPAKAGTVRMLALTSKARWPDLPDVPTTQELGYEELTFMPYVNVSGPLNLPSHVMEVWNRTLQEMVKDSEMISKMRGIGLVPHFLNSQESKNYILREIEQLNKL